MFSTKSAQYAFGETDQDGRKNIESFAAQHRSQRACNTSRRVLLLRQFSGQCASEVDTDDLAQRKRAKHAQEAVLAAVATTPET